MTKKKQPATVDDEREPELPYTPALVMPELQALMDSNVVTVKDSVVTFRAGHLEHVALQYVTDPVQAWRDYHDDIEVALRYCFEQWQMLTARYDTQ